MRKNNDIKGKSDQTETSKLMRLATVRLTGHTFAPWISRLKRV